MTPAEVLVAYRYQPNLECRHHMLKGPQEVAPVYLQTPHRIEALLLCHFLAMLAEALIEREIRASMKNAGLGGIPLYPELRDCPGPSAPRILEIFHDVQRHQLISEGRVVQTFEPHLTPLQGRSSTSYISQRASTPRQAPPEVGAHLDCEKCGTSVD